MSRIFQSCVYGCHPRYCDSVLSDLAACPFLVCIPPSRAFFVVLYTIQIAVLLSWQSHVSRLTSGHNSPFPLNDLTWFHAEDDIKG